MTDLVSFLTARLNEDEQVAQEAAKMAGGQRWAARYHVITQKPEPGRSGDTIAECAPFGGRYVAAHIRRHDPARVLAEVDAKREVVRLFERAYDYPGTFMNGFASTMEGALRLFAVAYAEHPDYREEWKP